MGSEPAAELEERGVTADPCSFADVESPTMSRPSRAWHLVARPAGEAKPSDFSCVTVTVPDPGPGQVLVRNDFLSVDPVMRWRMNAGESYIPNLPQFGLGEAMTGSAIGTVVASRQADVPTGATVLHSLGWREYALLEGSAARVVDTERAPAQAYLGVLGTTGLTAWAGLTDVAPVRDGDVVFVSGAAGAVGSVAGQFARKLGAAKVIGSAGGPEKAERLTGRYGFDTAIDYLDAALSAMSPHGRIALVGAVSGYNAAELPPGPANLPLAIGRRVTLRGMNVGDHAHLAADFVQRAAAWLRDGSLVADETVVDGIDQAVEGFLAMMRGAGTGKTLIRLIHD
jgi:NADPH-dependent curcumin reductase CurA